MNLKMGLPVHQQPSIGRNSHQRPTAQLFTCILLGTAAALAWLSPVPKVNAVFGRYNYLQFWLAVLLTGLALSAFLIATLPTGRRRGAGFRLFALWAGVLAGCSLAELGAFLLPMRNQMDNPWYFAAGGGVSESSELPFERPPHLRWEGLSRGDLALVNGDVDPYARTITFQTDWQGFRNEADIQLADILTIGDSYTEAGNVAEQESFSVLIGQRLGLKSRNLGRAGYGGPSELIVLRKYGLACRPKLVVWQVAESNDLEDALRFSRWATAGRPRFFDLSADQKWRRSKAWEQRSPTFRAFEFLRRPDPLHWQCDGWFRDHCGVEHPVRFMSRSTSDGSVHNHPGWPAQAEALTAGAMLCRSNHIKLLVMLIPTKYRVLGPHTRMVDSTISATPDASAATKANTLIGLLQSLCDSLQLPFTDATPVLEEGTKAGELVFLPYDTHLSPRGHQLVADLVVQRLHSMGQEVTSLGIPDHPGMTRGDDYKTSSKHSSLPTPMP